MVAATHKTDLVITPITVPCSPGGLSRARVVTLTVLIAVAISGCGGSTRDGQQVSGTVRALERVHHGKFSSKRCKAEGAGESCVLTWPNGATSEVTVSGPAGHHGHIVVVRG